MLPKAQTAPPARYNDGFLAVVVKSCGVFDTATVRKHCQNYET